MAESMTLEELKKQLLQLEKEMKFRSLRSSNSVGGLPEQKHLDGTNYGDWKFLMKNFLIDAGMWNCISPSSDQEIDVELDQRALAKINLSLKPSAAKITKKCVKAKDAWDALQNEYESTALVRLIDVNLGEWSDEPDENGVKTRLISYTLSINYSLGPKCSPSTETQHLLPESQPGACFLIDADCHNGGVPYADDFFTTVRYCITKVGDNETRLHISGRINYKKHIWGLIKTFIDKTASTGLATNFGVIANLFRRESERRKRENRRTVRSQKFNEHKSFSTSCKSHSKPKGSVKERVSRRSQWRNNLNCVAPYTDNSCVTRRRATVQPAQVDATYSSTTDILAMSIFIVVMFLVVVNLLLFYQITLLEATVTKVVVKYNTH